MTVLIIDDNQMMRTLLHMLLTENGYNVVGSTSNGQHGLELAIKLKPTFIFLDILMPDSNGIDILKMIMKNLPKTIVVMVTGIHDAQTVKAAFENGAKGYINKPFCASALSMAIKDAALKAVEQQKEPQ